MPCHVGTEIGEKESSGVEKRKLVSIGEVGEQASLRTVARVALGRIPLLVAVKCHLQPCMQEPQMV